MKLAVPKEVRDGETRVAATPETVKKLKALGLEVSVQAGAGNAARFADVDYQSAGAIIAPDTKATLADADIVLKVRGPDPSEIALLKKGAVLVALLAPHSEKDAAAALAAHGIIAFAMELLPRISRAQAMDVLSSQANLAGYKAVIDAAAGFGRDADDDDRGGHDRSGPCAGDGRGRRRLASHRYCQAIGRDRQRHRCASRHKRTSGKSRWHFCRRDGRGVQERPNGQRLCQANERRIPGKTGRANG